jgi:Fe-S-cluster-containing dehydrogenase component
MSRLATDNKKCTGCGLCEMVCSYHHTRSFDRKRSSVQIRRREHSGEFEIAICEERSRFPICDLCSNEISPLCAKWCWQKAIIIGENQL